MEPAEVNANHFAWLPGGRVALAGRTSGGVGMTADAVMR